MIFSGQENKVRVDTSQAGEGALSVNIRAAGQEVRHSIQVKIQKSKQTIFFTCNFRFTIVGKVLLSLQILNVQVQNTSPSGIWQG